MNDELSNVDPRIWDCLNSLSTGAGSRQEIEIHAAHLQALIAQDRHTTRAEFGKRLKAQAAYNGRRSMNDVIYPEDIDQLLEEYGE